VTLPGFVWRSARHPVPVLDLNLLRSRVLSSASASTLLYFASFGILLLSTVLWTEDRAALGSRTHTPTSRPQRGGQ
jgi:hypothetical protein